MLHFWLDCILKAFGDAAAFIGTNKTGFVFSIVVMISGIIVTLWPQVRRHGWAYVRRHWFSAVGWSAAFFLTFFAFVFLCYLIAAPHGLYMEAEAKRKVASADCEKRTADLTAIIKAERDVSTATAAELRANIATREGITETLQKQNVDQQSTINGCLSQAMKLLTPEQQKTTPIYFDNNSSTNVAIRTARWILLTNKPVTPVRMIIQCDKYLQSASAGPIAGVMLGSGSNRLTSYAWENNIQSPAWTPTLPFLATVSYRGGEEITCSFVVR